MCDELIIKPDPYSSDINFSKLELPDESDIGYNEEEYALSIRLSHFNSLLEYIKENVDFNIDFFTPIKIARIFNLGTFISWDEIFHPQPQGINTEALNKVIFMYQKDISNSFAISTLKSAASSCSEYSQEFLETLSDIKLLKQELDKSWIRENVLPDLKLPPVVDSSNKSQAYDLIRDKGKTLRRNLESTAINSIIKEDFSEDGDKLRSESLANALKLEPEETLEEEKTPKKPSRDTILKEILSEITKVTYQMDPLFEKIMENQELYREENYGFIAYIIDLIKYSLLKSKRETRYIINVKDAITGKMIPKEIVIEDFLARAQGLNKLLIKYGDSDSKEYQSLFHNQENDSIKEVHNILSKIFYIHKITDSLDSMFKLDTENPRGMQIELKAIKSIYDKCQALYNDFINTKDQKTT